MNEHRWNVSVSPRCLNDVSWFVCAYGAAAVMKKKKKMIIKLQQLNTHTYTHTLRSPQSQIEDRSVC